MSDAAQAPQQQLVAELKVSAHLMTLDAGVYCVYASADSAPPDPTTGLPAVRLTVPPGLLGRSVTLTSVKDDGWMGASDAVSLIRVTRGPAQILITIYQLPDSPQEPPKLQVTRLVEGTNAGPQDRTAVRAEPAEPSDASTVTGGIAHGDEPPEVFAHVQLRGDLGAKFGDWIGEPGSQRWIEGFGLQPGGAISVEDIEYQAVLGRGWLSPWAEGGQYSGSRGMALPILGLRVRLRGQAATTHRIEVSATFTDGTRVGPLGAGEACEADSLAPLEAFQVNLIALNEASDGTDAPAAGSAAMTPGDEPAADEPAAASKPAPRAARPKAAAKPAKAEPALFAPEPEPTPAAPKPKGRGKAR